METSKAPQKDKDPIIKALGSKTPMKAILAWAKTHKINDSVNDSFSPWVGEGKPDSSDTIKMMAINSIYLHHKSSFNSPIDIAKKIKHHYQNSKKMLDGRLVSEGKLIRIYLKKEVRQQLEKHKKHTEISHSDLLEDLLKAYFDEVESNNNSTSSNFKAIMEKTFPDFNIPTPDMTTKK